MPSEPAVVKFSRNGLERRSATRVSGVPPPKVLSLHHLTMPFRHRNIFDQLIFGKIITIIVATRGQILRLKCTK